MTKFEIQADIPEGYEPTGEYRKPHPDEYFLSGYCGSLLGQYYNSHGPRIILRKQKVKIWANVYLYDSSLGVSYPFAKPSTMVEHIPVEYTPGEPITITINPEK